MKGPGLNVRTTSGADANWLVSGTITVANPNDDAACGVDVSDAINDPNASCSVTGGANRTIAGNDSSTFAYGSITR